MTNGKSDSTFAGYREPSPTSVDSVERARLVAMLNERKDQDFDGECHITNEIADRIIAALTDTGEQGQGADPAFVASPSSREGVSTKGFNRGESARDWVGRNVRRTDTDDDDILGHAIVMAVDDTAYAPSAWIKYPCKDDARKRDYPSYRSVDLSDLEDVETEEGGPRWGADAAIVDTLPKGGDAKQAPGASQSGDGAKQSPDLGSDTGEEPSEAQMSRALLAEIRRQDGFIMDMSKLARVAMRAAGKGTGQ